MKAAVLEAIGQPLEIRELEPTTYENFPQQVALNHGQVLVRMLCTGICGSQLQEIDGNKGEPKYCPHLLGHEGCGIVESYGMGVHTVKVGDKVVLHWRKGVGCDAPGGVYGSVTSGPITTFSEYTIVSENRVTRIDDDVPNDVAALFGCCLSTALAIIENESGIKSYENSVTIIGCGGIGLAIVMAARRKTPNVFAWDKEPSKEKLAESLGACFFPSFTSDVRIDTVGVDQPVIGHTRKFISLQPGGTSAGGFLPSIDIPRYVKMWRDGELNDYKKLITHRIKLDEINDGIALMRAGKAGRVLIEFDN